MRIAILGAGFSGLSVAWHLLKKNPITVHLYDPLPIAEGASGLSSGLLHPFGGLHARYNWKTQEGINAALALFEEASLALEQKIYDKTAVLRPAIADTQLQDFAACAKKFSEAQLLTKKECEERVDGLNCLGGLLIENGFQSDPKLYLKGLFKACQNKGLELFASEVKDAYSLKNYDHVICTLGYATRQVKGFDHLPISLVKGHLIEFAWPQSIAPLKECLVSVGYVTMGADKKSCLAGTTFERDFASPNPDADFALKEIGEKVFPFLPFLEHAPMISCRAGVRAASAQGHLPIADKVGQGLWCLTGLGSKGLLYHAFLAQLLAQAICENNPNILPQEVRIKPHLCRSSLAL